MKFFVALPTFLSLSLGLAATVPLRRQDGPTVPSEGTCISQAKYTGLYNGIYSQGCASVTNDCTTQIRALEGDDIWNIDSCVAAATCNGPENVVTMAKCIRKSTPDTPFPNRADTSTLNYDIYASIVGDCAGQDGGCPITQQNYVDFIFGRISAVGGTQYPTADEVIKGYWTPIVEWANTGDSIPYTNFNDWLHFGTNLSSL